MLDAGNAIHVARNFFSLLTIYNKFLVLQRGGFRTCSIIEGIYRVLEAIDGLHDEDCKVENMFSELVFCPRNVVYCTRGCVNLNQV